VDYELELLVLLCSVNKKKKKKLYRKGKGFSQTNKLLSCSQQKSHQFSVLFQATIPVLSTEGQEWC
jgi:hypothetical protein